MLCLKILETLRIGDESGNREQNRRVSKGIEFPLPLKLYKYLGTNSSMTVELLG